MLRPDDSLNINGSGDFVFDLTREKINPYPSTHNQTLDDLEYSMDEASHDYILGQLKREEQVNNFKPIPNISAPITINREEDKKKDRKAIFEKYKQNNQTKKDVMQLFDDVIRGKNPIADGAITMIDSKKNQMMNTNRHQQVEAIPQTKMNPPPNLLKKSSFKETSPNVGNQIKTSNISLGGSFSINDGFSVILGTGNNQFAHSRQSQQIAELLDADIFGSFQQDQKSFIPIDVNDNHNSNMNILDDIRFSAIGINKKDSITKFQDNGNGILGLNLADSQEVNTFKTPEQQHPFVTQPIKEPIQQHVKQPVKQIIKQQIKEPIKEVIKEPIKQQDNLKVPQVAPRPSSEYQTYQGNDSNNNHIKFFGLPHHARLQPQPNFQKPTTANADKIRPVSNNINYTQPIQQSQKQSQPLPQPKPQYPVSQSQNSNSQLSIFSNLENKNNNSSHLMGSGSLNNALGALSQHIFHEAVVESRMPQLLQQSWRLNSISINIKSPTLSLDAIRHKEILRSLAFQQLIAAQTLQKFRDQLQNRQIKQKKMYTAFNLAGYLQGQWYEANKVRNNEAIRPRQPHPKRPIDFNIINQTLKNSVQVIKYFQNYIQQFKIEPTQDFKKKYIELRTSLFQVFGNLKKISEDLYMKSITLHLPQHYYKFYEFLKNTSFLNPSSLNKTQLQESIKQRQKILLQIQYFKNEHDPLACSDVAKDIDNKANSQLKTLKKAYYSVKKTSKY